MSVRIICADVLDGLAQLEDGSVHCCVTSPPYWGLRDYGIPPSLWGGDPVCGHEWGNQQRTPWANSVPGPNGRNKNTEDYVCRTKETGPFCSKCGAWRGCLGLEPTPALYVEHLVAVFQEIKRVLRDDGTLWLNLGDSYATGAGKASSPGGGAQGERFKDIGPAGYRGAHDISGKHAENTSIPSFQPNRMPQVGLKPKDMVMIPARVALALQADGWYLRSMIPWLKRNAMPESVTDRPATATEYVFLLAKSERYFYDGEAVKIKASPGTHERNALGYKHAFASQFQGSPTDKRYPEGKVIPPTRAAWKTPDGWDTSKGDGGHGSIHKAGREKGRKLAEPGSGTKNNASFDEAMAVMPVTRNRRNSDWFIESWQGLLTDDEGEPLALIVNPQPFKQAHFATWPPRLVEPMILAGTSERGCCAGCGAPWKRIVTATGGTIGKSWHDHSDDSAIGMSQVDRSTGPANAFESGDYRRETTGWKPTCKCGIAETVPATVLDPFGGAGTVGLVADRLQRNAVLIEIKPQYVDMARTRIDADAPLFAETT